MKIARQDDGSWDIKCDGTREDLLETANVIMAMSHEGVGKGMVDKPFTFYFNDSKITTTRHIELFMFGRGLFAAANTFAAKLLDKKLKDPTRIFKGHTGTVENKK